MTNAASRSSREPHRVDEQPLEGMVATWITGQVIGVDGVFGLV